MYPAPAEPTTLGGRLRELRKRRWPGRVVTQRELADALGLAMSSISGYENGALSPPEPRLREYATFFATARSVAGGTSRLLSDADLTDDEGARRDELLRELLSLRPQDPGAPASGGSAVYRRDPWSFPPGERIRLICGLLEDMTHPYRETSDPNYTELLSYADLDSLVELYAHLRMRNPDSDVRYLRADRLTAPDDINSHLVVLGGPGLNTGLQQILRRTALPVDQQEDKRIANGEVFVVRGRSAPFLPAFTGDELTEDVGLLARLTNPFNTSRTLTWCSGVYSRGVLGAVRTLTDAVLRDKNEAYLTERFAAATQFAILSRVPVVRGRALTPDLQNDDVRWYEWSDADAEQPGEARPTRDRREAVR